MKKLTLLSLGQSRSLSQCTNNGVQHHLLKPYPPPIHDELSITPVHGFKHHERKICKDKTASSCLLKEQELENETHLLAFQASIKIKLPSHGSRHPRHSCLLHRPFSLPIITICTLHRANRINKKPKQKYYPVRHSSDDHYPGQLLSIYAQKTAAAAAIDDE